MIRKLFMLSLLVVVCLELTQGKPSSQAEMIEEYTDALIQGLYIKHNLCMS